MILGIGTDICTIERIRTAWQKQPQAFLARLLTPAELAEPWVQNLPQTVGTLARRWAAKEAIAKALGTGIGAQTSFQHITITHTPAGAPQAHMPTRPDLRIHLSLSDESTHAIAFAVVETQ